MRHIRYTFFDKIRIPKINNPRHMRLSRLTVDLEKCRECGICVTVCVFGCLETERFKKMDFFSRKARGGKYGVPRLENIKNDTNYCFACNCCGAACPHGAITMEKSYSPGFRFKRLTQTTEMTYPKMY